MEWGKPTYHYLQVPYTEKDEAKALGARWDSNKKQWYYTGKVDNRFNKWTPTHCMELSDLSDEQQTMIQLAKQGKNVLVDACIKRILRKQSPDVPVMITNSHVNAYNFIHNYVSDDEKLLLVNIDMHHDIVNSNKHLDCGNWISFLLEEYEMKLNWVASPVSFQMYGFDKTSEENEILKNLITPNLAIIEDKDYKYDGIFLCRSDTWTPPHLDKYFSSLCNIIAKRFNNVVAEEGIRQCRVYKPITEQLRKSIKNFNTETE